MPAYPIFTKPQNSVQKVVDSVPFLGVFLLLVLLSTFLLGTVSFIGGLLQLMEVTSVYSRVLPGVPTWAYFGAAVGLGIVTKLLGKCLPG